MKFVQVHTKEAWIENNHTETEKNILQSWEYGEFLKRAGRNVVRIQTYYNKKLFQCQYIIHKALGNIVRFVYIPRIYIDNGDILSGLLTHLKEKKYTFVRIEPFHRRVSTPLFKSKNVLNRQIPNTLILDITSENNNLLDTFHQKTRYNIKLAQRKGVYIKKEKNIGLYWKLNQETADRDHFYTHPKKYFEELLNSDFSYQLIAYYNTVPIASIILVHYLNTLYYFFGASADMYRNTMAPYALQWHAIQLGKEVGCTQYDMWGSAPFIDATSEDAECKSSICWSKNNPLAGVTRFKAGFSGRPYTYPPAQEYILNPLSYIIYNGYSRFISKGRIIGHPIS